MVVPERSETPFADLFVCEDDPIVYAVHSPHYFFLSKRRGVEWRVKRIGWLKLECLWPAVGPPVLSLLRLYYGSDLGTFSVSEGISMCVD